MLTPCSTNISDRKRVVSDTETKSIHEIALCHFLKFLSVFVLHRFTLSANACVLAILIYKALKHTET